VLQVWQKQGGLAQDVITLGEMRAKGMRMLEVACRRSIAGSQLFE